MRIVFLLVLVAGAAFGYGYPYAISHMAGREIGNWAVHDAATGFHSVETALDPADAPLKTILDMTAIAPAEPPSGQSALTLTVATGGKTVVAETLDLVDAEVREDSPQTPQKIYRMEAAPMHDVADGVYTFTVGPGDAEGLEVMTVELRLATGSRAYDKRAQPIGLSVMAIGFIGLAMSLRRRRDRVADNGPASPEPPRWGRGGSPDA